jgi:hypothetical protein
MYQIVENGVLRQILKPENGLIKVGTAAISTKNINKNKGLHNIYPIVKPDYNPDNQELSKAFFDAEEKIVTHHIFDVAELNKKKWIERDRIGNNLKTPVRLKILLEDTTGEGIWKDTAVDLLIKESPSYRVNENDELSPEGNFKHVYLMYIDEEDKESIDQYILTKSEFGVKKEIIE